MSIDTRVVAELRRSVRAPRVARDEEVTAVGERRKERDDVPEQLAFARWPALDHHRDRGADGDGRPERL